MRNLPIVLVLASITVACQPAAPTFRGAAPRGAREVPEAEAPAPVTPERAVAAEPSRDGWNEAQIDWQSYDEGLARAQRTDRPVCLVIQADWCPHCRTYSHVFEDPRVVEASRSFVMIRVDSDEQREVAGRYALDGGYVPRTHFLGADGTSMSGVVAHTDRFRYFFDEHDPASLLAGMASALRQHGG